MVNAVFVIGILLLFYNAILINHIDLRVRIGNVWRCIDAISGWHGLTPQVSDRLEAARAKVRLAEYSSSMLRTSIRPIDRSPGAMLSTVEHELNRISMELEVTQCPISGHWKFLLLWQWLLPVVIAGFGYAYVDLSRGDILIILAMGFFVGILQTVLRRIG